VLNPQFIHAALTSDFVMDIAKKKYGSYSWMLWMAFCWVFVEEFVFRTLWPFAVECIIKEQELNYFLAHIIGSVAFGLAHKSNSAFLLGHTQLGNQWKYQVQSVSHMVTTASVGYILFPLSYAQRVIIHQIFNAMGMTYMFIGWVIYCWIQGPSFLMKKQLDDYKTQEKEKEEEDADKTEESKTICNRNTL
jgi:membrane protease YdiL (CAAX protease family)